MGPSKLLELFNFPDPSVTRGRRVATRPLKQHVRAIDSGILIRKGEIPSAAARRFTIAVCNRR